MRFGSSELLVKVDAIANWQNVNYSFQKSQKSLITKSSEEPEVYRIATMN
jgi:hypothetical protein